MIRDLENKCVYPRRMHTHRDSGRCTQTNTFCTETSYTLILRMLRLKVPSAESLSSQPDAKNPLPLTHFTQAYLKTLHKQREREGGKACVCAHVCVNLALTLFLVLFVQSAVQWRNTPCLSHPLHYLDQELSLMFNSPARGYAASRQSRTAPPKCALQT